MQTTKRRRMGLDSGYEHLADPSQAYIGQHDNSQYPRNVAMYGSNDDADPARPSGYSLDASSVAAAGHTLRPAGALGATSGTGQDWDAPPYSEVYPDTTAYSQTAQHPYYGGYAKQSTDPSTYNSPWPPQAQSRTESFGAPTSNNYGDSGPNNMPYLGASDNGVLDVNSSYDSVVASNLEGYGQDVDMSVDYVYDAADTAPQAVSAPMDDSSHMVCNIFYTSRTKPGRRSPKLSEGSRALGKSGADARLLRLLRAADFAKDQKGSLHIKTSAQITMPTATRYDHRTPLTSAGIR